MIVNCYLKLNEKMRLQNLFDKLIRVPIDNTMNSAIYPDNSTKKHSENLYPKCDVTVLIRSCKEEIINPIKPVATKGEIPKWLNGSLLRNGPGSLKVGDMEFNHLFDSSALLHRFCIKNGEVTYQCRFIKTDTYKKNKAANRIVVTDFGTSSVPDPCQSIFHKISSIFNISNSDNTMISIYPFGDEFYTFTESPIIHKINPDNLETESKINVSKFVGIVNHTSHPHIISNKTVYNLGISVTTSGPAYNIICFPNGEHMFKDAFVVGSIPSRWKFHPGYMHSFGITDNYFVIVEQPLTISVPLFVKGKIKNEALISCLKWFSNEYTYIYIMDRYSGELKYTFVAKAFFYMHIINQYEKDNHIIIDICCYKNPSLLNAMYVESIRNGNNNPNYAKMFRGKPLRFVLPLKATKHSLNQNLVTLSNTEAKAYKTKNELILCKPEILCELGCETPRFNYDEKLGKEYRYFYAISSDVDAENPGALIKVDVKNKTRKIWFEENCYPSEPIFVPTPNSKFEDDGVILASMIWGLNDVKRIGLLVLCANKWIELGRCDFITPAPVPKCLHGWYKNNF